jgi:hypothetical protein
VDCSRCNNQFGGGIDKALADQFADIRNMLQLPSGSGRPPPTMRNVKAGSETINIAGDGTIRPQSKPFEIVTLPGEVKNLRIKARSFEEIVALMPHMAAALSITPEQLREQLSKLDGWVVERRPGPVRRDFQFGGLQVVRSVAKACLVLWATLVGNDEVQSYRYDEVRNFIIGQNDEFLKVKTDLDSRFLNLPHEIAEVYGPAFNLIYLKSDSNGRIIGHFTIFNILAISIVLAPSGGPPDKCVALISNPFTGDWSDKVADTLDIPFIWLNNPDYDYENMDRSGQRLSSIMEYYVSSKRKEQTVRIIEDVLKGQGLTEGDLLTKDMANSISSKIAERLVHLVFNLPLEKKVDSAEVKETLDRIFAGNTLA